MPDPGGQWPPRSISLRLFFLLKLCQLLEKVESRDAPGLRVWLLGGDIGTQQGSSCTSPGGRVLKTRFAETVPQKHSWTS